MDMKKWAQDQIAADKKKALPVLSFPGIQKIGCNVKELLFDPKLQADAMKAVAESCDTAASVSFMDLSVEADAFGSEIVYSEEEVPTVVGSILDEDSDPDDLEVPEVGTGRTGNYIKAIEEVAPIIDDRPVLAGIIGPYSLAGRLMDVNEIMYLLYDEPELVKAVTQKCTDFLIGYARAFKEAGADGVVMAEPLSGLLPPAMVEEFSTPFVKQVVDAVQDDSFGLVYHNCGNGTVKAAETIFSVGAMGYHFGNAIDMADMMPLAPEDVLVMGNVDPAGQFRMGTPESIREATLDVLGKCSKYPNFVISSGCDIPPMSPWENIDAFFAAVDEFYAD